MAKFLTFTFTIIFCLVSGLGIAQDNPYHNILQKKFTNYEIATINSEAVYQQLSVSSRNNNVVLDLGNGMKWTMELEVNPIFSERYSMVFGNQVSGNPIKEGRVKPMKGKLKNIQDSKVSLSFNKGFIYGEVKIGLTSYFIEPLSYHVQGESPDKFIYYSINDIIQDTEYQCGYEKYKSEMEQFKNKEQIPGTRLPGGCFIVEYALAADWSMVTKHGSAQGVENHITGVVNNVQNNYDNEFDDEIQFELVTFWISSCSTCDPWSSSTNSSTVLNSFTSWANGGGFGTVHDVGSMWSNRVYQDNVVGLAWLSVICTSNRYNILRDFTSNANQLRVMTAHELGHNFSAGHDASGSNTIMAPTVNTSNSWSAASRTAIQNHYLSRWCLTNCNNTPPPVANFSFNVLSQCLVGQVQYTDQSTNATSWSWTFPGGTPATSTQQNPLVSYINIGTYGATLVASNTAGSNTKTINNIITTRTVPNASFTYTVNGSTVTFTNTSTNATSYSWDFGDGNLSALTNPVHTYQNDGFYNVVLTAYNDCGPNDKSEIIEIATPPTANFSANPVSGCSPLAVNFNDESSSNSIQWTWTFEGGVPNQSFVRFPNVIYNQPGLYSVTLTVANPQGSSTFVRQQYIEVAPDPTSSFTYVKNGLTASFTNTSVHATDYIWNFGDGNTSTLQNPVHTYAQAGTYTVTLQSSNDCTSASSSQVIVFTLAPIANFSTINSPEGCSPYTVNFIQTAQNNPTSFAWTFEGGIPSTSTEPNPSVLYQNPGTFNVTLIATNNLGSDTLEIDNYVSILTVPDASFTYQNNGLTFDFTSNLQNADTFSWDFGDGTQSTLADPSHTYSAEGTYTVVLTASNVCGDVTSSQTVNVLLSPNAQFSADILSGCTPLTVQFTDESSPNTSQWNWSFPGGNPSSSTLQNPVVTYQNPGSFSVTLIAGNAAGQDTRTKSDYIQTLTSPTTGFSISVDGPTVTLTNTGSGASQTDWQIQDNGLQSLSGQSITYTFSSNGSFSIRQINSNDCGSTNLEQFITISAYPNANFVGVADGNCAPVSIHFLNHSSNSTSYVWNFENGIPATSTEQNPTVLFNEGGTFEISLTATNQYGSSTTTQSITLQQLPIPDFSNTANSLTISITNQSSGSGNSFAWNFGDGNFSSAENPVHTYAFPGTYTVELIVTNECGSQSVTKEIVVDNRIPQVEFNASTRFGCAPLEVQFMDESTNDPDSWNWTFDGGDPSSSTEKNPVVVYQNEGIYDVRLSVSNGFGSSEHVENAYITVYGPPNAQFDYTQMDGEITTVYTGNLASSYSWDFGDGSRSASQSPKHKYTSSGTYTVILIIENPCGRDTFSRDIDIIISSTSDSQFEGIVKIAPNPNSGVFNILFDQMGGQFVSIEIFNMLGQPVYRLNHVLALEKEIVPFDNLTLLPGNYLVKIVNEKGKSLTRKVNVVK